MLRMFSRKPRDETRTALADGLKRRLRDHLRLDAADELTVSEIACPDPACPGTETVILVLRARRRTLALKIAKPMAEIEGDDIAALSLPGDAQG